MNTATPFKQSIEDLQREILETRKRISGITGISEDKLEMMMVDSALDWLELITNNNAEAIAAIPRMREFWGFWKKVWHKTDLAFLKCYEQWDLRRREEELYYNHFHRITTDNPNLNNSSVRCDYMMLARHINSLFNLYTLCQKQQLRTSPSQGLI